MWVKSRVPEKNKGIVHQVRCKDCDGVYTGESKRTLKVRLTEHKRAVVSSDVNNSIVTDQESLTELELVLNMTIYK